MKTLKDKDLASFSQRLPWPPAFHMEVQTFMPHFPPLPFGPEDEKYITYYKAQISYLKKVSQAALDFYTEVEAMLVKPARSRT
jgi:hypothetical protein